MRRFVPLLMAFAAGLFVASSAVFLFQPVVQSASDVPTVMAPLAGAPPSFAQPQSLALRLLMVTVWIAILAHTLRTVLRQRREAAKPAHAADHTLAEHGPLILSLLAAAAWPWAAQVGPVAGLLTAATMMAGALVAVYRGDRDGRRVRQRASVGLYAGWATAATFRAFEGFLALTVGVAPMVAVIAGILLLTLATIRVQLLLGGAIGFTIGVIWVLIGTASGAMAGNVGIVTAAVVGIAALSAVLVKVTT